MDALEVLGLLASPALAEDLMDDDWGSCHGEPQCSIEVQQPERQPLSVAVGDPYLAGGDSGMQSLPVIVLDNVLSLRLPQGRQALRAAQLAMNLARQVGPLEVCSAVPALV